MSTIFETKPQSGHNLAEMSHKLEFQKRLQAVTNKIHATSNIDEIMGISVAPLAHLTCELALG